MDPRIHRTQFAAQAASLADQFQLALVGYRVGAHRAEMTAPEASTAGGVQALQHIRLVPPPNDKGGHVYVVGNANRIGRVAELRSLEYIDRVSLERFGERSGFDPGQYAAFIAAAAQFLENFGLTVSHATRAVSLRPAAPTTSAPRSNMILALVVVWSLALLAIGVAVGVAMHGRH
jgi:hypothetical protein